MARTLPAWSEVMAGTFGELYRITRTGGHVAFEVGDVRGGSLRLEDEVLRVGVQAGFRALGILVNEQVFTKTSHIWGIANQDKGTNTNRIVLFRKD